MSGHLVRDVKKIRSVVRRHPRGVPPNAELTEPQPSTPRFAPPSD